MSRKCRVLRRFRKRKIIVCSAWIKMRKKLEVARQDRKPEWQQTSEIGEQMCVNNYSYLWEEGKGRGKGQVLG